MTDFRLLDKRTVQRHIQRGALSESEYKRFMQELTDLESSTDTVQIKSDDSDELSE